MKKRMITILALTMLYMTGCSKKASSSSSAASATASTQPQTTADSVVPGDITAKDVEIIFEDSKCHLGENPVTLFEALDSNGWKYSGSSLIDGSSLRIDFEHDSYEQNLSVCLKSEEDLGSVHKEIVDSIYTKDYSVTENTQVYSIDAEVTSMDAVGYDLKFKIGNVGIGSAKDDVIAMLEKLSANVNEYERTDDSTGIVVCSANATHYYDDGNSFVDFTFWINTTEDKCYGARAVWAGKE